MFLDYREGGLGGDPTGVEPVPGHLHVTGHAPLLAPAVLHQPVVPGGPGRRRGGGEVRVLAGSVVLHPVADSQHAVVQLVAAAPQVVVDPGLQDSQQDPFKTLASLSELSLWRF